MIMDNNYEDYQAFNHGELKHLLKKICASYGVELCGIAPARVYEELLPILQKRRAEGHYTDFEERQLQKRINPFLTMEACRSIIVCLFPYFTGSDMPSNISLHAHGRDYHIIVKNYLEKIASSLSEKIPGFECLTFTDSSPLPERHLAYLAGLGFYGRNGMLISEKYGSYVFIGFIMNNFPFEADNPLSKTCQSCGECLKRCPGKALDNGFEFSPGKCVSYITQKKGSLNTEESNILMNQNSVYGCDICQTVCPHNINAGITPLAEFHDAHICTLDYKELRDMSERQFRRKYKDRAFAWRGRKTLLRNMEIIFQNKSNTANPPENAVIKDL